MTLNSLLRTGIIKQDKTQNWNSIVHDMQLAFLEQNMNNCYESAK